MRLYASIAMGQRRARISVRSAAQATTTPTDSPRRDHCSGLVLSRSPFANRASASSRDPNSQVCMPVPDPALGAGAMKVHGKGKKERISWLNDDNLELLKKWLEARRRLRHQNDYIFVRMDGKPMQARNLRSLFQ